VCVKFLRLFEDARSSSWKKDEFLTFELSILDGKHVEGKKLQKSGATDRHWRVLQKSPEFSEHLMGSFLKCIHSATKKFKL